MSGHLLPMDLPATALDMIRRFLFMESFEDTPLPSEEFYYQNLLALPTPSDVSVSLDNVGPSNTARVVVAMVAITVVICLLFALLCVHSRLKLSKRGLFRYSLNSNRAAINGQYIEIPSISHTDDKWVNQNNWSTTLPVSIQSEKSRSQGVPCTYQTI